MHGIRRKNGFKILYDPEIIAFHPLYNYKSVLDVFKRSLYFNTWRLKVNKRNKILRKNYDILSIASLFFIFLISISIFLRVTYWILLITIFSIIVLAFYIFNSFFKRNVPLKYLPGILVTELIKKMIGYIVFLFKISPKKGDWKNR